MYICTKCSNSYCIRRWSQLRYRHYKSSVRHKYMLLSGHQALDHTPSLHAWFAITKRQLLNYRDTSMCLQSVLQSNFINYLIKTHTWNYKEVLVNVIIKIETALIRWPSNMNCGPGFWNLGELLCVIKRAFVRAKTCRFRLHNTSTV